MAVQLSQEDYALFAETRPLPQSDPRREPSRSPIRAVPDPKKPSRARQNQAARRAWRRSLSTYVLMGGVALGAFLVIQSGADIQVAVKQKQVLEATLVEVKNMSIQIQRDVELKYSPDLIYQYATERLRMTRAEAGSVTYLSAQK